MGKVFFYMTVSVDGFVAGPADDVDRLFRWYFSGDTEIPIAGSPTLEGLKGKCRDPARREPDGRGDGHRSPELRHRTGLGCNSPTSPCFVPPHSVPDDWAHEGSPFVFVTDGIQSAIGQAKRAAGQGDSTRHADSAPAGPQRRSGRRDPHRPRATASWPGRSPLRSPHDRADRSRDHSIRAGAGRHAPSLPSCAMIEPR